VKGFAGSGLTGKRISSGDGQPIRRANGDNMLATVRTGEVILNERHQAMLGGANTFRSIGVPGFAGGGSTQMGGSFPISSISAPIQNKFDMENILIQTVKNQPPVVALIQDIQNANDKIIEVRNAATV